MKNLIHTFQGKSKVQILLIDGRYYAQDKYWNKRYLCKAPNLKLIEAFIEQYQECEFVLDGELETTFKKFKTSFKKQNKK